MPITPLLAALFGLAYLFLSFNVIKHRLGKKIILGTGEDRDLKKAVRIHGNFAEYVPFTLLLLWFLETITFEHNLALVLGCVLLVARVAHVVGMTSHRQYFIFRQFGVIATFAVIAISSIAIIWHYFPI